MEQFANNPSTTLNGAITSGATSLVVTSAALFSTAGYFRLIIDSEIILVTSVSGATFTVTRGQEGTSAASHATGATVTQLLTAAGLLTLRPIYKEKTSDETVSASVTLQDDNDLVFAALANAIYRVQYCLIYEAPTANDLKFNFSKPSGCTHRASVLGLDFSATGPTGTVVAYSTTLDLLVGGAGVGTTIAALVTVIFRMSSTPGNIVLQWAQQNSGGSTIMKANSHLIAEQVG